MEERNESREHAVDRLDTAREERATRSQKYDSVRGSVQELPAFTELRAAEEQYAAREAWLKWIDREY